MIIFSGLNTAKVEKFVKKIQNKYRIWNYFMISSQKFVFFVKCNYFMTEKKNKSPKGGL